MKTVTHLIFFAMKTSIVTTTATLLAFLNASLVFGQDDKLKKVIESPFAKGNTLWNMSNDLKFSWKSLESNGESAGNQNRFGLHVEGTYFVVDNVGVGIGLSSEKIRTKNGDIDEIDVTTLGSVNALYGHATGGIVNVYGRGEFSAGVGKSKYESPGYSEDNKYNKYGLNFEVGAPLALGKSSGFLVTPFVNYDYYVSKDDSYKDSKSGINIGTRLNISLPCASYAHNCEQISTFSENMYTKGTNVLGGSTSFWMQFGTEKSSYIGDDMYNEYENSLSDMWASLVIEYYRYIFDNLAFGAKMRVYGSGEKDKETDYKQNDFTWMLTPTIQANLPVTGTLNNSFGFVGYGFGGSKDKTTGTNNQTTETKYNTSELSFGVGYNLYMAKNLALVPIINYSMYTSKEVDSDEKNKWSGIEAGFSMRYSFNFE
jgi:hypothetical protein